MLLPACASSSKPSSSPVHGPKHVKHHPSNMSLDNAPPMLSGKPYFFQPQSQIDEGWEATLLRAEEKTLFSVW